MSKFRIGDIAFSFADGFGEVSVMDDYIRHADRNYFKDGKRNKYDKHPSLLTVEEAAKLGYIYEKPKKLVKKELVGWVNVYQSGSIYYYKTKAEAEAYRCKECIATVEVRGSYEVLE